MIIVSAYRTACVVRSTEKTANTTGALISTSLQIPNLVIQSAPCGFAVDGVNAAVDSFFPVLSRSADRRIRSRLGAPIGLPSSEKFEIQPKKKKRSAYSITCILHVRVLKALGSPGPKHDVSRPQQPRRSFKARGNSNDKDDWFTLMALALATSA